MKRKVFFALTALITTISLAGCGSSNTQTASLSQGESVLSEAASTQTESIVYNKEDNAINLKDVHWSAQNGVRNEKRMCLLSIENNTPYTITDFKIVFKPKSNLTDKKIQSAFTNFKTSKGQSLNSKDFEKTCLESTTKKIMDPGESSKNLELRVEVDSSYQGEVDSLNEYNVTHADTMKITFIGTDNLLHQGEIDCLTGTYTDSGKTKSVDQWSNNGLGALISKPSAKVIEVSFDDEYTYNASVGGMSQSDFETYVNDCKQKGFTENATGSSGNSYMADNSDGINLWLTYNSSEERCSISLESYGNNISKTESQQSSPAETPTPTPTATPTPTSTPEPTPATDASPTKDVTYNSYQEILAAYTKKLQDTSPTLVNEYNQRASQNSDGINGLAQICNEEVQKLAAISNEGVQKMASLYFTSSNGKYEEYQNYATQLTNVYMTESQKVTSAYISSAS